MTTGTDRQSHTSIAKSHRSSRSVGHRSVKSQAMSRVSSIFENKSATVSTTRRQNKDDAQLYKQVSTVVLGEQAAPQKVKEPIAKKVQDHNVVSDLIQTLENSRSSM